MAATWDDLLAVCPVVYAIGRGGRGAGGGWARQARVGKSWLAIYKVDVSYVYSIHLEAIVSIGRPPVRLAHSTCVPRE